MRKLCKDWTVMKLPEKYHPLFFKREITSVNGEERFILKRVNCD
jgi:hypothetical protein